MGTHGYALMDIRQAKAVYRQEQQDKSAPMPPPKIENLDLLPMAPNHVVLGAAPVASDEPSLLITKCLHHLKDHNFDALTKLIDLGRVTPEDVAFELLEYAVENQSLEQVKWLLSQWEYPQDVMDKVVQHSENVLISLYASSFASPKAINLLSRRLTSHDAFDAEGHLRTLSQRTTHPVAHLFIVGSALRNHCPDPVVLDVVSAATHHCQHLDVNQESVLEAWTQINTSLMYQKTDSVMHAVLSLPHAQTGDFLLRECVRGNIELVKWMLQLPSCDPNFKNGKALFLANSHNHDHLVDFLFEVCDVDQFMQYHPPAPGSYAFNKYAARQSKQELQQVVEDLGQASTSKSKM